MPGGFVDAGEQPSDAAMRELLEEVGIAAGSWRVVDAIGDWYNREKGVSTCNICFVAAARSNAELRPGSDALAARWVAPGEVMDLLAFDNQREFYRRYLADGEEAGSADVARRGLVFKIFCVIANVLLIALLVCAAVSWLR